MISLNVNGKTREVAKTIAAALVTVHPGGMREMHWHPNADEWQYWIKGKGRMTVFNTGPNALTMDFNPGDIGYVKRNLGHYMENVGDTDMVVLEVFRSSYFADISLSDWLARTPPALVAQHLNVDVATIATRIASIAPTRTNRLVVLEFMCTSLVDYHFVD